MSNHLIRVKITDEVNENLETIACAKGLTVQQIIRHAVQIYIDCEGDQYLDTGETLND